MYEGLLNRKFRIEMIITYSIQNFCVYCPNLVFLMQVVDLGKTSTNYGAYTVSSVLLLLIGRRLVMKLKIDSFQDVHCRLQFPPDQFALE